MHDALHHAREVARHGHETHDTASPGGVAINGDFVGHAAKRPPAGQGAAACLAVAEDGQTHLARPADFRGGLEGANLGSPEPLSTHQESAESPLPS